VNTANQIGQTYGVDPGAIQSIIQIDPKTGEVDGESVERAYQRAEKIRNPMLDTASRSQAKDALNAVQAQLELMQQDTVLFEDPKATKPLDRPVDTWRTWAPTEEQLKTYDTKRGAYNELKAREMELLQQLAGSVSQTATQDTPQAQPQAQPQPQEMNFTQDAPFEAKSKVSSEIAAELKAFLEAAKGSKVDQYFVHPVTKKILKVPASN